MKPFGPEVEKTIPIPERPPSHLKEGVPAIMACVGTPDEFREHPRAEKFAFREKVWGIEGAHDVDYYGNPRDLARQKFKNPKRNSYVISPIDNLDKISKSFINCTGLVVTGYDKTTGENISFLSHEDPSYIFGGEFARDSFLADIKQCLAELKKRCEDGTVDAAIVGGNYLKTGENYQEYQQRYRDSIKLLSDTATKILGFEPVVITGPKMMGSEDVFYENKSRRLYISRPEVGDSTTESFKPSDIKKQEKKW